MAEDTVNYNAALDTHARSSVCILHTRSGGRKAEGVRGLATSSAFPPVLHKSSSDVDAQLENELLHLFPVICNKPPLCAYT